MLEEEKHRKEFLLKMYEQLCIENNRNIGFVVQSVSVIIGAFAILSLTEKKIIDMDIASILIILICTWFLRLILDSNYWYNRNLAMISNIEREFLLSSDLKDIHYYFAKPRAANSMLTNYRAQIWLGSGIAIIILLYHFLTRVLPGINEPWSNFEIQRCVPYIVTLVCICTLLKMQKKQKKKYEEFISQSPGKQQDFRGNDFDISQINYGAGHPVD
ncbi:MULTISPECIES: hypothetical protein [Bacillus cereus group]|uniref:Uncharacterized protein n=1 Tax=Bacillus cereus TaxID=1396 RepID=A0A2A7HU94_BACCE|nr:MULTISPECIES: hypothetical protein [Bacillus cereus group]PEC20551.1 hypothetical protein COM96_18745 [Bacillus cereus]PEE97790.1 hypothetical protein CON21_26295 [Bacillus thuringiensis]